MWDFVGYKSKLLQDLHDPIQMGKQTVTSEALKTEVG